MIKSLLETSNYGNYPEVPSLSSCMEVVGVLLLFSLALFYRETAAASCGTDGPVTHGRDCIEFTLITDDSPSSLNCIYYDVWSLQRSVRVQYRGADDATWITISVSNIETVKC